MRRRRAMMLVEALIMGAGYKAARFPGQAKTPGRAHKGRPWGGLCSIVVAGIKA
jgi:hypothetical protein